MSKEGMITIICEKPGCGKSRDIYPQDVFQVKFCEECQKGHRNEKARARRAERRKAKEAQKTAEAAQKARQERENINEQLATEQPEMDSEQVRRALAQHGPKTTA